MKDELEFDPELEELADMFDWDEDAYEDWEDFWKDYYPDLDDDENRTANKKAGDKDSLSPTSK